MSKEQFFKLLQWVLDEDDWLEPHAAVNVLNGVIGFTKEQRIWAEEWQQQAEREATGERGSDGE